MKYRDKPFRDRVHILGDTAEDVFLDVAPLGKSERLGWRRPENITMKNMVHNIRHMPDFYTQDGHLVEVMGCGRDGILKVKLSKYEALKWWATSGQAVALFVWNSSAEEWALLSWSQIKGVIAEARRRGVKQFENDGIEYYPVEWTRIRERVGVRKV